MKPTPFETATVRRAGGRKFAAVALLASACALLASCEVPTGEPNSVAVDTGAVGRLMPGAYFILSWPTAEYACRGKSRSADVQDVKDGVVTYRCVDGDAK